MSAITTDTPTGSGCELFDSVAVMNLLRLYEFTSAQRYRARAEKALGAFARGLDSSPQAFSEMLLALDFYLDKPKEIVIVTPAEGKAGAEPLLAEFRRAFVPNRIVTVLQQGDELDAQARVIPLVDKKRALHNRATAYVCEQGICQLPTADPAVFAKQIAAVEPLRPAPSR